MAYANIQRAQVVTDLSLPAGATSTKTITGVAAGSLLLAVGSYYITTGITCELLSAADDKSNTWAVIENNQNAAGPGAILFAAVAHNVAGGDTEVTLTFTAHANSRRISWAIYEITGAKTSAAVSLIATGDSPSSAMSVSITTGNLGQTDNLLVCCFGVWGNWNAGISDPSGAWSQALKNSNGTNLGVLIGDVKVTSLASRTVTGGGSQLPSNAITGFVLAVKAAEVGSYKYVADNFDPADLTTSDSGITALVWRNGDYTNKLPEVYTGLACTVDGEIEIDAGLPPDVATTDDIVMRIFNGTKHSPFVIGAVVEVV